MEALSNGALLLTLLLAAAFAFPVSFGLIMLYRRAVLKFMNARANSQWNEPSAFAAAAPFSSPGAVPALPAVTVFDAASAIPSAANAEALYKRMQFAKWRAAAIYVIAGICYAFVMTLVYTGGASESVFNPVRTTLLTVIFAFPILPTVNIVAAADLRAKLITAAIYFFILAVLGVITIIINLDPQTTLMYIVFLFLMTNLPGIILLQAFLMRRIRAVGPLVLIFMFFIIFGSQVAVSIAGSDDRLLRFSIRAGDEVAGLGAVGVLVALFVLGVIVLSPVGWFVLRRIAARYEKGKISDQSITIDAVWVLFSLLNSLLLASSGILWGLLGILPFLAYRAVSRIGFKLLGAPADGKELLILRVFSLGKKSERLFRALGTHWRYAGSVRLIAAPDLAASTIEPHEFLDFVSGRLSRRFIDRPETFDLRLSETRGASDWDGRFRVTDFLCYDNTWQAVLSRLVRESKVVLMDLRGFSTQNAGCVFEINELINLAPLEQIVFVIDERTDGRFLLDNVRQAWERMKPTSPNRVARPAQLRLFRFADTNGFELRQLLLTLCAAAEKS